MSDFQTFRSRNTVRARQVDAEEGETVVTPRGPVPASKGDYVLAHDNGGVQVVPATDFEDSWEQEPE